MIRPTCSSNLGHDGLDCPSIGSGLDIAWVNIRLHSNQEIFVATGTVKWFNASKGFGFIQADDGSKDVFVHISAVEKAGLSTLNEGQKIQYELQKGQDGKTSAGDLKSI
jgi:CspA family cold shock protein